MQGRYSTLYMVALIILNDKLTIKEKKKEKKSLVASFQFIISETKRKR